jgi:hypothetical protein
MRVVPSPSFDDPKKIIWKLHLYFPRCHPTLNFVIFSRNGIMAPWEKMYTSIDLKVFGDTTLF